MELPTLKTMTQAGGRLSEEFQKYFYELSKKKDFKFFVMYGQTEATARISYVPPERLSEKYGSIGIAIPNGEIRVMTDSRDVTSEGLEGELIYRGKNVMMGYAQSRECLAKGDEFNGILHTGDVARMDKEGFFFITGRMKRFIKIFGLRLNLDEVEKMVENYSGCAVACTGTDDELKVLIQSNDNNLENDIKRKIVEVYKIHHTVVKTKCSDIIPITPSGKRDYKMMNEMIF